MRRSCRLQQLVVPNRLLRPQEPENAAARITHVVAAAGAVISMPHARIRRVFHTLLFLFAAGPGRCHGPAIVDAQGVAGVRENIEMVIDLEAFGNASLAAQNRILNELATIRHGRLPSVDNEMLLIKHVILILKQAGNDLQVVVLRCRRLRIILHEELVRLLPCLPDFVLQNGRNVGLR